MEDYAQYFSFPLGEDQQKTFDALCRFVDNKDDNIFVLRGYAGSGKTSLIGGFIKKLHNDHLKRVNATEVNSLQVPYYIMASTGRAAKVLSDKTIAKATTVHSIVYHVTGIGENSDTIIASNDQQIYEKSGQLRLNFEATVCKSNETAVYIVDEASMIADEKNLSTSSNAIFGEGDLLGDLLKYAKNGQFIFVGDPCQLPPIFQKKSPALDSLHLKTKYKKRVVEYSLSKIYRHNDNNDILACATYIRKMWEAGEKNQYSNPYGCTYPVLGYNSITVEKDYNRFLDLYINKIIEKGYEHSTLICHSNKECNTLGNIVRQRIHHVNDVIIENDLLLITQNNMSGLVNGDIVVVKKIRLESKDVHSGLTFMEIEVEELASKRHYTQLLILDLLSSGASNLSTEQHARLMRDFCIMMKSKGIVFTKITDSMKKSKSSEEIDEISKMNDLFIDEMRRDSYLNALRANYGYALTCHKSQGGEWNETFLFLGKSLFAKRGDIGLFQWLYTAVTRAKEHIYAFAEMPFNLRYPTL